MDGRKDVAERSLGANSIHMAKALLYMYSDIDDRNQFSLHEAKNVRAVACLGDDNVMISASILLFPDPC